MTDHLSALYLHIPPLTATFSELVLSSLIDQAVSGMEQRVAASLLRDSNTQMMYIYFAIHLGTRFSKLVGDCAAVFSHQTYPLCRNLHFDYTGVCHPLRQYPESEKLLASV